MEFDPALVLLGAVILLLAAILIGVIAGVTWFWRRDQPGADEWIVEDLDHLGARVAAMSEQIAMFKAEIDDLSEEIERLQDERDHLLTVLLRIAELLEHFPRGGMR